MHPVFANWKLHPKVDKIRPFRELGYTASFSRNIFAVRKVRQHDNIESFAIWKRKWEAVAEFENDRGV